MNETLTLANGLGTLLTVAGIMILSWDRKGVAVIVVPALLLASGAAIIRGVNHTIGKYGLGLMPNPFMAAFISFTVAFFGAVLVYRFRTGSLPRPATI